MKIYVREEESLETKIYNAYYDPFGTLVVNYKSPNGKTLIIELNDDKKEFYITRTTMNIKTGEEEEKKNLTFRWEYVNSPTTRIFNRLKETIQGWIEQIKKELED